GGRHRQQGECVGWRCHPGRRPHHGDQLTAVTPEGAPMSTLGYLPAEHTMLPGNAVDHLHAVVGEWQLLADLSFADYLMWVHRDDGALVCVAQVRPNTAPTVLLADAVGTLEGDDHVPLVTAAFESGTIGRENIGGQEDSAGLKVEAVPVRY